MSKIGVVLNALVTHLNFYMFLGIEFGDLQLRFGENRLLWLNQRCLKIFLRKFSQGIATLVHPIAKLARNMIETILVEMWLSTMM